MNPTFSAVISPRSKQGPRIRFKKVLVYVALCLGVLFFSGPLVWLVLNSLKLERDFSGYPIHLLPVKWAWANYWLALTTADFLRYLKNSVVLSTLYTLLCTTSSTFAGFAFARLRAPGRNLFFSIVVMTLLLPTTIFLIPHFIIWKTLGAMNTYWPWIIGGSCGSAFHIFLFHQFFVNFPQELEDAAEVDGCSTPRIFWNIVLPNSLPVVITSAIFNFQAMWGDIVGPLLYLNDRTTTLAVALSGVKYVDYQGIMIVTVTLAGAVLFMVPIVLLFFLAQRYIVEGVVTTGLSGR